MNSKRLLVVSALAAAVAAATAPMTVSALTPVGGTPVSGLKCLNGYAGTLSGTVFKCTKTQVINVVLECLNPKFPNYVIRATNGAASDGRDLCALNGVNIGTNTSLNGLVQDKDYIYAATNPATIASRTSNKDHDEAVALGLTDADVDTVAGTPALKTNGGSGSKDNADVTLTYFTFAVPNKIIVPFPVAK